MKRVVITGPTRLPIEEINEPTEIVVARPMEKPALTIVGGKKVGTGWRNRRDGLLPFLRLNCDWMAPTGIVFEELDRVDIPRVEVIRARDSGIVFESLRESHVGSLYVSECLGEAGGPAVAIRSAEALGNRRVDASNGSLFDFIDVAACGNETYLKIQGTGPDLETARHLRITYAFLHCPWAGVPDAGLQPNPYRNPAAIYEKLMEPRSRTMLDLYQTFAVSVGFHIRLDATPSPRHYALALAYSRFAVLSGSIIGPPTEDGLAPLLMGHAASTDTNRVSGTWNGRAFTPLGVL